MMASGAYFFIGVQPHNRASLPCFVGSQGLSSGPERFFKQSLERLSGNSERASFRGPKSPHEGAKWHNFRRSALPRKARSDPFGYFPDSLSRKPAEQTCRHHT